MASNRWASGSVAGVSIVDSGGRDCRVDVLDGEPFSQAWVGSSQVALDLTVHTQLLARTNKGIRFGIHIAQVPVTFRTSVVAAIKTALDAGNSFRVILSDSAGIDSIDVMCVPDFEQAGSIYKRGPIAAGYIKDFVMRFVVTGPHP